MPQSQSESVEFASEQKASKNAAVLVVDDDPVTRKLVDKALREAGFQCQGVGSGEEALERLENERPDLILCDIVMPEMDGIEFCAYARINPRLEEIPIIMFTGLSSMDSLSQAYEAGADDYVIKPFRQVELVTRIDHHIEEYERRRESRNRIQNLNEQNESKTKFLGVASHDLRNPLASIHGISQYLESERYGPLNEGQRELVSTIVQASDSMLKLVDDLMDVSMFESGQMRIAPKSQSLEDLVDQAISLHSANASRKEIRLAKTVQATDTQAEFDQRLLVRVIDNLVSNAIKFSPRSTLVRLVIEGDGETVTLKVEDEGPGIPENEFDALFKEFGRTSNQPTAGESSSGIGLFVCERIVLRHGGSIHAENRASGGARFTVKLNRSLADE